eukprot:TRINITY_DN66616_c5_g1_i1.p1 TRINITY_DN66616_c5_g1~~TRINITY_DN66616_c5_g1_i1.p1  ORF type:complete len:861 (-),score=108.08 TRINITY_DN66616_c5_g1_i1:275-2857(-)
MPVVATKPRPKYETIRRIGGGTFGNVYLVRNTFTEEEFALKKIKCTNVNDANNALKEAFTMRAFSHPCIIRYVDAFFNGDNDGNVQVSLVMEYYPEGDFSQLLGPTLPRLPPNKFVEIMSQVSDALSFLHSNKLVHRDLKPSNILLAENQTRFLLTDFGLVRELERDHLTTVTGTPAYMAPEQAKGKYNTAADIWALGCIMMEVIAPPLEPYVVYMEALTKGWDTFKQESIQNMKKSGYPSDLIDLTISCLQLEPTKRPSATDVHTALQALVGQEFPELPSKVSPAKRQRSLKDDLEARGMSEIYHSFLYTMSGTTKKDDDGLFHWIEGKAWFWYDDQTGGWFWSSDKKIWNHQPVAGMAEDLQCIVEYLVEDKPTPEQLQEFWAQQLHSTPQHLRVPRKRSSSLPTDSQVPQLQQLPHLAQQQPQTPLQHAPLQHPALGGGAVPPSPIQPVSGLGGAIPQTPPQRIAPTTPLMQSPSTHGVKGVAGLVPVPPSPPTTLPPQAHLGQRHPSNNAPAISAAMGLAMPRQGVSELNFAVPLQKNLHQHQDKNSILEINISEAQANNDRREHNEQKRELELALEREKDLEKDQREQAFFQQLAVQAQQAQLRHQQPQQQSQRELELIQQQLAQQQLQRERERQLQQQQQQQQLQAARLREHIAVQDQLSGIGAGGYAAARHPSSSNHSSVGSSEGLAMPQPHTYISGSGGSNPANAARIGMEPMVQMAPVGGVARGRIHSHQEVLYDVGNGVGVVDNSGQQVVMVPSTTNSQQVVTDNMGVQHMPQFQPHEGDAMLSPLVVCTDEATGAVFLADPSNQVTSMDAAAVAAARSDHLWTSLMDNVLPVQEVSIPLVYATSHQHYR